MSSEMQVTRIFGVYTEEYQRSRKDRFPVKNYMGVCSRESLPINTMRVAFATRVMEYTPRKTTNRTSCVLGSVVKPTRMNSVTV